MTARTTIGRRALCAAPAALLLPQAAAPLAPAEHPDAALLAVLAAFYANTRQIEDCYSDGRTPIHDEDERDSFLEPARQRERELIGQLCMLHATTPAGCLARAACLVSWEPHLARGAEDDDNDPQSRQIAAILRDMVEVRGVG